MNRALFTCTYRPQLNNRTASCKKNEHTNSWQLQIAQTRPMPLSSAVSFCDISALAFRLFTGPYTTGMCDGGNSCGSKGTFENKTTYTNFIYHHRSVTIYVSKCKAWHSKQWNAPIQKWKLITHSLRLNFLPSTTHVLVLNVREVLIHLPTRLTFTGGHTTETESVSTESDTQVS